MDAYLEQWINESINEIKFKKLFNRWESKQENKNSKWCYIYPTIDGSTYINNEIF